MLTGQPPVKFKAIVNSPGVPVPDVTQNLVS